MRRMIPIALILALTGCYDETPVEPAHTPNTGAEAAESMMRSGAPFPLWQQGFETGTDGWITDDTPGPAGWCGDIEAVQDGMMPSAGRSHAVVRQGACNAFWQDNGFAASGPYSPGAGFSETWPVGGYTSELDIYLDPSWTPGHVFTVALSINLLDRPFPTGLRYFMIPVMADGDAVQVAGHAVEDAGWYTFRFTATGDGGQLALDFEVSDHGQALVGMPLTTTAFSGENTGSFTASNVGSGYLWFVAIADGLDLPIDEHQVRRGR